MSRLRSSIVFCELPTRYSILFIFYLEGMMFRPGELVTSIGKPCFFKMYIYFFKKSARAHLHIIHEFLKKVRCVLFKFCILR